MRKIWFLMPACLASHVLASEPQFGLDNYELVFETTDAIRLVSEELLISREKIEVNYVFENLSEEDQTMQMAFPIDTGLAGFDPNPSLAHALGQDGEASETFTTTINDEPVEASQTRIAYNQFEDITQQIEALGIDINQPATEWSEEQQISLEREGLMVEGLYNFQIYDVFRWDVRFPAGETITMHHAYKPSLGSELAMPGDDYLNWSYCIEEDVQNQLKEKYPDEYWANSINYVFGTGGHWAGTIGAISVTIDKGQADAIASFCAEDVKAISDTKLQFTLEDYEPVPDDIFKVLFVD